MNIDAKSPGLLRASGRRDRAQGAGAGVVRIIGGHWRRSKIPVVDVPGLRPTPDRVRETLFNWLGQDLAGWRCVDAFAGTGALGLEAASRGAAEVLWIEQDGKALNHLQAVLDGLRSRTRASDGPPPSLRAQRGNALAILRNLPPGSQQLVFLDPPFDASELVPAALALARAVVAQESGFVYLEASRAWDAQQLAELGFQLWRYLKAGNVHAHVLRVCA